MQWATEIVVLALVCLSPWPFASVEPEHVFLLDVGVATLMVLWGAAMLLEGKLAWRRSPVLGCLAALVVLGLWQIMLLPEGLLGGISPATARLYHKILPAEPEVLPFGEPRDDPSPTAGSTLSVYPEATRSELARLVAVLLLFAVVRQRVASVASLRRLSLLALANGTLLAVFGLVQFFSSDPHTVFWTVSTAGAVFRPFVNQNHYAFYVNVCISLGVGLLLARLGARVGAGPALDRASRVRRPAGSQGIASLSLRSLGPLPEAETLGIAFALALMMSSVVVSLSRGGLLALAGGLLLGLLIWTLQSGWSAQGKIFLLTPAVVLALVQWFGFEQIATRLETLRGGEVLNEGRLTFWSQALPLVRDFPAWGTGFGTYDFLNRMARRDAVGAGVMVEHVHNDYLEVLVEFGLPGLLAIVLAVVLAFRLGFRAVRRDRGRPVSGLALGALIGLATIAIHSRTALLASAK